jgi:cytochrome c oxidase assembly protein subunit 15
MASSTSSLRRWALITLMLLYATVLAGSVVRATGSGMGCPDWPTCFGRLVPPTDVSQLPADYRTRFATPKIEIAEFNVVHTWVEYLNRLVGMGGGLAMLVTAVLAFRERRRDPVLPPLLFGSLACFALVSWMGRTVVDTNLAPWNITLHMLGALVLVAAAIIAAVRIGERKQPRSARVLAAGPRLLVWAVLLATLTQVVLGTQVREQVDHLSAMNESCCRDRWIGQLGLVFSIHKTSAWVLVAFGLTCFISLRAQQFRGAWLLPAFLGAEYILGVVLVRYHLPAVAQPAHLFLATLLFGLLVAWLAASGKPSALPLHEPGDGRMSREPSGETL